MTRRGCATGLTILLTVGTLVWLFRRDAVIFPIEASPFDGFAPLEGMSQFYRNVAVCAVVGVAGVFLWAFQQRNEEARVKAAVCAALITAAAVFVAWFNTNMHFMPQQRDAQIKEIVTWAAAVVTPALAFHILTARETKRSPKPPQGQLPQ